MKFEWWRILAIVFACFAFAAAAGEPELIALIDPERFIFWIFTWEQLLAVVLGLLALFAAGCRPARLWLKAQRRKYHDNDYMEDVTGMDLNR